MMRLAIRFGMTGNGNTRADHMMDLANDGGTVLAVPNRLLSPSPDQPIRRDGFN